MGHIKKKLKEGEPMAKRKKTEKVTKTEKKKTYSGNRAKDAVEKNLLRFNDVFAELVNFLKIFPLKKTKRRPAVIVNNRLVHLRK